MGRRFEFTRQRFGLGGNWRGSRRGRHNFGEDGFGELYNLQQELADPGRGPAPVERDMSASQRRLFESVGFEVVSLEDLQRLTGDPIAALLSDLSELELCGQISRCPGGYIRC